VTVNGPEDVLVWDAIDWRGHEQNVRRLRQRIFKAAQAQDWPKVRNLQRLMLRSRSNTLVSVRQVAQHNAGRVTAGIDGEVALTPEARRDVAVRVHQSIRSWQPRAVRRVYIPKSGNRAKLRPLGIPVIADRCHQARARNALEPEWEARFEPRSYGFRPGRSCQDAVRVIHTSCKGPQAKRVWALDADLAAAFDRINHDYLLGAIVSIQAAGPGAAVSDRWLRFGGGRGVAGAAERGSGMIAGCDRCAAGGAACGSA
jgi:RNA-directed DNA polymerase